MPANEAVPLLGPPHQLTLKQIKAYDVFCYWSPKLDREVMVIGVVSYRLGVWLEGRSDVIVYRERPWGLVKNGMQADFEGLIKTQEHPFGRRELFAYRRKSRDGGAVGALAKDDKALAAFEARAAAENLPLNWFDDRKDLALQLEVTNLTRMLPYVTAHARNGGRLIESDILSVVTAGKSTMGAIEDALENHLAVRGALFAMHFKGRLAIDMGAELNRKSFIRVPA